MSQTFVEWSVATRAYPGQSESGDRHLVAALSRGVLLAAVDGLGHGEEAAAAARSAVHTLEAHRTEPLVSLVRRCHARLAGSRGVAVSLALYDALEGTLSWMGIGNVTGILLRADASANPSRETLLLRSGVLGFQLPQLDAAVLPVSRGDMLVFATDGVRSDFESSLTPGKPPQQAADQILALHRRPDDDALVLVVRFTGVAP